MDFAYAAIILLLLGGDEPETKVIHLDFYKEESSCNTWRDERYKKKTEVIDEATGKPIKTQMFICQLVDKEFLAKLMQNPR